MGNTNDLPELDFETASKASADLVKALQLMVASFLEEVSSVLDDEIGHVADQMKVLASTDEEKALAVGFETSLVALFTPVLYLRNTMAMFENQRLVTEALKDG